jgi:hypothetical protein
VELRAASHGARNVVEKELLQAVYAYEEALSVKRGAGLVRRGRGR